MRIVLVEPKIPQNTGNIARLCAATGIPLDLVGTLGFELSDRYLKRAGLDYWRWVKLSHYPSVEEYFEHRGDSGFYFLSKRATVTYSEASFTKEDCLVFGSETEGLPQWLFERFPDQFLCIPIMNKNVRSLNLSSAVAVVAYEALRQVGYRVK